MEQDSIPVTTKARLRLEALKRQWKLSTDGQVLERLLHPGHPSHSKGSRSREQALRRLRRATKPLRGKSLQELKQEIHEEALRQAGA